MQDNASTPSSRSTASAPSAGAPGTALATQYSTFIVAGRLCGIDVTRVQEVVRPLPITVVPLAPSHVAGLINLRGQIATAVNLRELFALEPRAIDQQMNVVCGVEGALLSLLVDEIGDVMEVATGDFERTPATIHMPVRNFMSGVFRTQGSLLSVIDVGLIGAFLGSARKSRFAD